MKNARTYSGNLRAGAGRAEIALPPTLFPTEGLVGIHDALSVRVLVLEAVNKVAVVSVELTSLPGEEIAALRALVGETAGLPPENVWVCVTHTFSAPHMVPERNRSSAELREKSTLLSGAVREATRQAASEAVKGAREALLGGDAGTCSVNANRDVLTTEGWWLGVSETGPSDKSVPVLRVETPRGELIALLFSYAVQPSVMDEPPSVGDRLVTADLAGAASRFVERQYGDTVPVIFCIGTAGDQAPALKGARQPYVGKDGRMALEQVDDRGFAVAEMLGARLGAEVLRVSECIECGPFDGPITIRKGTFKCPGQTGDTDPHGARPKREHEFVPAEEREETVEMLGLGDVALVGVRPELSAQTGLHIREQSPYRQTMVLTMVNGGAKYMPEQTAYDRITYEATHSPFARGSAELLCERVARLLKDAKR